MSNVYTCSGGPRKMPCAPPRRPRHSYGISARWNRELVAGCACRHCRWVHKFGRKTLGRRRPS